MNVETSWRMSGRIAERCAILAWSRRAVLAAILSLLAVAALLTLRRAVGAFSASLPVMQLVATVMAVGLLVLGGRVVWRPSDSSMDCEWWNSLIVGWGGTVAILLAAVGCSLGGRAVDWIFWLALVAVDQWQLRWFSGGGPRSGGFATPEERHDAPATDRDVVKQSWDGLDQSGTPRLAPRRPGPSSTFEGGGCEVQRLVRTRDEEGIESIHGLLRAEFIRGQRHAVLHVGFCPPLECVPEVMVEAGEGPDAEVRVVQAFCHGARLDVRLAEAAGEACAVVVEMSARPQQIEEEMARG
jgi:hypothetical protein